MRFLNPSLLLLLRRILLLAGIYTLLRGLFLLGNGDVFQSSNTSDITAAFLIGLRFDLVAITIINLPIILLHLMPDRWLRSTPVLKGLNTFFYLLNIPFLLANCVDLELFRFSSRRMTADIFSILGLGDDFINTAPKMVADFWLQLIVFLALCAVMIVATKRISSSFRQSKIAPQSMARRLTSTTLLLTITFFGFRGGFQLKPLSILAASGYGSGKEAPLILNSSFTLLKTFGKNQLLPVHYYNLETAERLSPTKHCYGNDSTFRRKNVVVIILEGIGKEYIGALSGLPTYTPFLDSLIGHSLAFRQAYANGKRSIEGIPAVVAGIPALIDVPFISSPYSSNTISSFANLLKSKGYTSVFFHGGTNGTMGFDGFSKIAGYDRYFGRSEYGDEKDFDHNWGIYDMPFLQRTAQELHQLPTPFHATVFTLSSHHPYSIPENLKSKIPQGTLPIHQSVRYADEALRNFFTTASQFPWFDNTLFILTADHTSLAEYPFYKTRAGIYAIPVIFFAPGDTLTGISDRTTQQIDLLPSALDYLNFPDTFFAFGTSVFQSEEKGYAINFLNGTYQLIQDNYALVYDTVAVSMLFDVVQDPAQRVNLLDSLVVKGENMESRLKAILQQHNQAMIENKMRLSVVK